jgi:hypothetical protein
MLATLWLTIITSGLSLGCYLAIDCTLGPTEEEKKRRLQVPKTIFENYVYV